MIKSLKKYRCFLFTDYPYHHHHQSHPYNHDYHYTDYNRRHYQQAPPYLPRRPPSHDYKSYEPYLPPDSKYGKWPYYDNSRYHSERDRDRNYWGLKGYTWGTYGRPASRYNDYNNRRTDQNRSYYLPPKVGTSRSWGAYAGTYGHSYSNWGTNKPTSTAKYYNYGELPPYEKSSYLPVNTYDRPRKPYEQPPVARGSVKYLPVSTYDDRLRSFHSYGANSLDTQDKHVLVPSKPTGYNFVQEGIYLPQQLFYITLKVEVH